MEKLFPLVTGPLKIQPRTLKVETSTYGCLLIPILKERLPDELIVIISRKFAGNIWSLDVLLKYFHDELQAKENCFSIISKNSSSDLNKNDRKNNYTAAGLHAHQQNRPHGPLARCVYCLDDHPPSQCQKVTNIKSRYDILKKYGKCFVCLKSGHIAKYCPSNYICRKCNGKHNISVCNKDNSANSVVSHVDASSSILLQTARTEVVSIDDLHSLTTRILFDSGSQRTYVTDNVRKLLKLKTIRSEKVMIKTFGQNNDSEMKTLDVVQFKVKYRRENRYVFVEAMCVPVICCPLTRQCISLAQRKFEHLKGLDLADFGGDGSGESMVGILVGVDLYHSFISGKIVKGLYGPVASESVLGWILSGPVTSGNSFSTQFCFETHSMRSDLRGFGEEVDELRNDLTRFWTAETIGDGDECVVHQFEKDIVHNGDRYVTKLPFKQDHDLLPDNFKVSEARLRNLTKRLKDKNLVKDYDAIFKEYQSSGIIERVADAEVAKPTGEVHYLPHRPVVRADKATTKVRAVFDASCAANGPSLNDCLYSGPNFLSKIFDILLRFRFNFIAILADIKQAFLNVQIAEEHKDFLRFLWYDDVTKERDAKMIIFRFLRVVFGVTSSPFLLNGTIRHHLNKYAEQEKTFVEKFLEDLYVDDTTSGTQTVEEGKIFYEKAKHIMSGAGFNLRKWVSNNTEMQNYFNEKENIDKNNLTESGDDVTFLECQLNHENNSNFKRVLGIEWDTESDEFIFQFSEFVKTAKNLEKTKRNILKMAASIYDPLGFLSPVTARIKTIFQLLCRDKHEWDESVTGEIARVWGEFLSDLDNLNSVRIKRFVFVREKVIKISLHGFADSSNQVYCGVVYMCIETSVGMRVNFLASKNKVAPLKSLSIPRLELSGCVLLSKLLSDIMVAIGKRFVIDNVFCWTDSEVVLCWIKGKEKCWKPWVENRVVGIRKIVDREKWNHVSGVVNTADIPTRVCTFGEFERWFYGPEFIHSVHFEVEDFDVSKKLKLVDVVVESRSKENEKFKKNSVVNMLETVSGFETRCDVENFENVEIGNKVDCERGDNGDEELAVVYNISVEHVHFVERTIVERGFDLSVIDATRYSSLNKLVMVTGYVLRFVNN